MDRIRISDLALRCVIGVNEDERREKQDVSINVAIHADLSKACRSDRFEDTIDYRALKKRIAAMVEGSHFYLLEALTQAVADVCLENPAVAKVDVRVDKNAALRFARSVGVEITRERARAARAFVGVGSNIEPEKNVAEAVRLLAGRARVAGVSTVYETAPLGRPGEPPYYNCVVELITESPPLEVKASVLRPIEARLGRVRTQDKSAPRTIDLDLIAYDGVALETEELVLPDPEIMRRPWLAAGLAELAPDLVLTGLPARAADVAAAMPQSGMKRLDSYTARLRKEAGHDG